MATAGEVFKPGEEVPRSGIYRVIHDTNHSQEHEVTCVYGKVFPPMQSLWTPRAICFGTRGTAHRRKR